MDARVEAWMTRGDFLDVDGRRIFWWEQGSGSPVLALHGFPASSYDWRHLADLLPGHRFIAFDLPGFGLSDKSPTGDYSLEGHATIAERLLAHLEVEACDVVAHDIGDSVAAELMHRLNNGSLSFEVGRIALLNGSIFIDLAQLTSGQKLFLKLPARPMKVAPPVRMFRRQIKSLFSPQHRPPEDEFEMMETFLKHEGGHRIIPITIRYINERRRNQQRWTDSLVDFPGDLALLWGDLDTVAVPAMATRLEELRPSTRVTRWPDVAHWPQVEVPDRVAVELQTLFT
jgi:pimeloyl-ACP methyl ester carboxylesterase